MTSWLCKIDSKIKGIGLDYWWIKYVLTLNASGSVTEYNCVYNIYLTDNYKGYLTAGSLLFLCALIC